MQRFIFLAFTRQEKEAQQKAFSDALKYYEDAAIEGAFISTDNINPEEFYKTVNPRVKLIVANAYCLSDIILNSKDLPNLKKMPLIATSVFDGASVEDIVNSDFNLAGSTTGGYKNLSPRLAAAGIREADNGMGANLSDISKALNVIGFVERRQLGEKNPTTVEEPKTKILLKAIKSIVQKRPNIWKPVIQALIEAENSRTDMTWESLSKFDEGHIFSPGGRFSNSSRSHHPQPIL
jgi:hypothetical protein